MNHEERQKWLCQQCVNPQQCEYVDRGFENLCPVIQETMQGWQLGYKDAANKAYEWLINRYKNQGAVLLDDINELKLIMEEQQ